MKVLNSILFVCSITTLSIFYSCSSDDSGGAVGDNTIVFNGTNYAMVDGLIQDYGAGNPLDVPADDSHYNYDFSISDAEFEEYTVDFGGFTETYTGAGLNATIVIYIELFSPGTSGFQAGTFSYLEFSDDLQPSDIADDFFFFGGEVELDSDGTENGDLDGDEFEITGGSVTVVGSGTTDYTITYDLMTDGGAVTGTYSGSFTYEND